MHAVFLYHAIRAGHGHGHRQRRPARVYEEIPPSCASAVEDVMLNRRATPPSGCSSSPSGSRAGRRAKREAEDLAWREGRSKRLEHALVKGIDEFVEDTEEARRSSARPLTSSRAR
jgi:5-methyltetrahydrofolate--homocysteine methyltransferase